MKKNIFKFLTGIIFIISFNQIIFADEFGGKSGNEGEIITVDGEGQNVEGSGNDYFNCPEGYICDSMGNKCQGESCGLDGSGNLYGNNITLTDGTICEGNCKIQDGKLTGDKITTSNTVCSANGGICFYYILSGELAASGGAKTVTIITNPDGSKVVTEVDTSKGGNVSISSNGKIIINGESDIKTVITDSNGNETITEVTTGVNDVLTTNTNGSVDNIDDSDSSEVDNSEGTTSLPDSDCPLDLSQKYEEMLLKSNVYFDFESKIIETGNELENLFQTGSDISNFTKIKSEKFQEKIDEIEYNEIFESLFKNSYIIQDIIDRNFVGKYLYQSPEGDFILHKKYYENNNDFIQKDIINKLSEQILDLDDLKNIISGNFVFENFNFSSEDENIIDKQELIKKVSSYVFEPYLDFLKEIRKDVIKNILTECKRDTLNSGYDILCGINVNVKSSGGGRKGFLGLGGRREKETKNVYSFTDSITEKAIQLSDLEYKIFIFENIVSGNYYDIDSSSVESYIQSLDYSEYFKLSSSDKNRICGSLSDCNSSLNTTIKDNLLTKGFNSLGDLDKIDLNSVSDKINISELVSDMKNKYENHVKNYQFQKVFKENFGTSGISITQIDETGNPTENSQEQVPQNFINLFSEGFDCYNSDQLFNFLNSSFSDFSKMSSDDFLNNSGILDNLGVDDISIENINQFISENSNGTIEITMVAPTLNPNIQTGGGGGGCPFLYVEQNGEKKFIGSVLIERVFEFKKGDSFEKIKSNFSENENIKISIAEILPETLHLDEASGILVKHDKNQEIFLNKEGKIFGVEKNFLEEDKKISDQEKNIGEINLGKFSDENLIIFEGGIDSKGKSFKKMFSFLTYGFFAKNYYFGGSFLEKVFYSAVDNNFIGPKFFSFVQEFYGIKFQYKDGEKWITFEEINTYPQEKRIVKISDEILNKEVRIKFYPGMNKISKVFLTENFVENLEGKKILAKNSEILSKTDGNILKIKQGNYIDLEFSFENEKLENEEEFSFYLKTNGFYRYLEK